MVDRVLPAVPMRQWVLSLPFELRALAAFRADVLASLVRIFVEAIDRRHRTWAKRVGLGDAPTGAVTHVQRFGSSVNLNVHFHVMVLDGVFTRDEGGRPVFHAAPPPTRDELDEVVRRVQRPTASWLARNGHLGGSPDEGATTPTPLDACAAIAMQRGAVRVLGEDPHTEHDGAAGPNPPPSEGGRRARRVQPSRQRRVTDDTIRRLGRGIRHSPFDVSTAAAKLGVLAHSGRCVYHTHRRSSSSGRPS